MTGDGRSIDLTPLIAALAGLMRGPSGRFRCLDCGGHKPHQARRLCATCYHRRARNGTLHERPGHRGPVPQLRSRAAVARFEDYAWLRGPGGGRLSIAQAATRAGVGERTAARYEQRIKAIAAAKAGAA